MAREEAETSLTSPTTKRKTAYDLFPEDDPRRLFARSRELEHGDENGMWRKGSLMRVIESAGRGTAPNGSDDDVVGGDDDSDDGCGDVHSHDDIVENVGDMEEDGRSMHPSGMVGSTAASKLIDDDARVVGNIDSREQGLDVQVDDGNGAGDITSSPRRESNTFTSAVNDRREVVDNGITVGEGGRSSTTSTTEFPDVKYPSRIKYLLMPPGFHSWLSVFEYVGDFFMLPKFSRLCRLAMSRMPLSPTGHRRDDGGDDDDGGFDHGILLTSVGKELSGGEQELLRCAGLDMYLLIRFARFGFNATFYPFCAAFVFVLPVYHSMTNATNPLIPVEIDAGYLSLTINRIPDGSKAIAWIVLLTIFLYLYILRMLWIEWEGKNGFWSQIYSPLVLSWVSQQLNSFRKSLLNSDTTS